MIKNLYLYVVIRLRKFSTRIDNLIWRDYKMNRIGKLYFRYGTMGSAKTALLLTTAYNLEERGLAYLCFKPATDTREEKSVIRSRIGIERECKWIYPETNLYEVVTRMSDEGGHVPDWILVDEAQFLTIPHVEQLAEIVDDFGCNIVCYGLRTDFKSKMFEGSMRLFELADTIEEVRSTCSCGRRTVINARIDGRGELMNEGAQVEIGGNDRYVALCRKCWNDRRRNVNKSGRLPFNPGEL